MATTVHEVLSIDCPAALTVLLNLIGSAAAGKDISPAFPDVVQAVFSKSSGNNQLKKLAYEVFKAGTPTPKDGAKLWTGIRVSALSKLLWSHAKTVACRAILALMIPRWALLHWTSCPTFQQLSYLGFTK
jgi:hypothetical protein